MLKIHSHHREMRFFDAKIASRVRIPPVGIAGGAVGHSRRLNESHYNRSYGDVRRFFEKERR